MLLYVDSNYASPYAMLVYVALREKKLPFDVEAIDLGKKAASSPSYATLSITQRVPTLVDGNFSLSESSAIAEYLNEAFPGPALYPAEAKKRARARQVQAWLRSDLLPIRKERDTTQLFYGTAVSALSVEARFAVKKLFSGARALLSHGGPNLCGEEWSIADVDLAVMLNRLVLNNDPVPEDLVAYATRQWSRPSVQQWVQLDRPPL